MIQSLQLPLFTVSNHHDDSCGSPLAVDGDAKGKYTGYFQNMLGEQFVFVYDRETEEGLLWAGDWNWDNAVQVQAGVVEGVNLTESEQLWLQACWKAATASG